MPIEGVKELIAYRYPQAIFTGFAFGEQERYLGIGTMTALLEKTVDLAHRRAVELEAAAIIGSAELLLMRGIEQREQHRGYIADIRYSGAHLLALINDILDYSKLARGRSPPLSDIVFDLRRFLQRAPGARAGGGRRASLSICRCRGQLRSTATSGACADAW